MIRADAMHSPVASTPSSFGLRPVDESRPALFCMAAGIAAALVILQHAAIRMLRHAGRNMRGC
jgi:hypothetical protein